MTIRGHVAATAVAAVLLAGCGGGGDGGGLVGNLSSAPGEPALSAYLQASHQGTLNASYLGDSYELQFSSVPNAGTTTFEGFAPAYSVVQTVTLKQNGQLLANDASTVYFALNPYEPLGVVSSGGTPYAVVTSSSPLPATINVGESGAFDSMTYYHDSSKAVMDADETVSYSVTANNSTTLLLCLNFTIANVTQQGLTDGMDNGTEKDCYTVNAAGNAALVSVAVTVGGNTLTFN